MLKTDVTGVSDRSIDLDKSPSILGRLRIFHPLVKVKWMARKVRCNHLQRDLDHGTHNRVDRTGRLLLRSHRATLNLICLLFLLVEFSQGSSTVNLVKPARLLQTFHIEELFRCDFFNDVPFGSPS